MVKRLVLAGALIVALAGCSTSETPAAAKPAAKKLLKVMDESRKMPLENRVSSGTVPDHAMGKEWLPGGTVAHYKKGNKEWDLFLVEGGAVDAPLWLLKYFKELDESKVVPSFGGYYGLDKGKPTFIFTKGTFLAGVVGLPQAEADLVARPFAARVN